MKKVITLLLSVVLVFGVAAPAAFAAADAGVVQPRYARLDSIAIDFSIDSDWKSTCYCSAESTVSTDTVDLTMELQRLEGKDWVTKKTWTSSDTWFTSLNKNWYVTPGYDYRLKIIVKVYDASGTLLEMLVDYA